MSDKEVLSFKEAGELVGVHPRTISGWPIKRVRLGHRTVRILKADLLAYLKTKAA